MPLNVYTDYPSNWGRMNIPCPFTVSTLGDLVMELHSKFSTPERILVAYKGGIQEKLLLDKLGLPYVNLEDLGCLHFDKLVSEEGTRRFECSHHLHTRPDFIAHFPNTNVTRLSHGRWHDDEKRDDWLLGPFTCSCL